MYTQVNSIYKMQYCVVVGAFCQAYCETMPVTTFSKLGRIIDTIPEWLINLGCEKPNDEWSTIEGSIPYIVEGILRAFEVSNIYKELWKAGIGFIQLAAMDKLMKTALEKRYNTPVTRRNNDLLP